MDSALREGLVFELFGAETATGAVASPTIVIALNIIKHRRHHYFPAGKALAVDAFHFYQVEEAFHKGIVITASLYTHADTQIMMLLQRLLIC